MSEATIRTIYKIVREEILAAIPKQTAETRKKISSKVFCDQCVENIRRRLHEIKEEKKTRPKRPAGAYIMWSNEHREEARSIVLEEMSSNSNSDTNQQVVSKRTMEKLGEMWRALDDTEKRQWKDRSEKAHIEFSLVHGLRKKDLSDMSSKEKVDYFKEKIQDAIERSTEEKRYYFNVTTNRSNQRNKKMEEKYSFDDDVNICGKEKDILDVIELLGD